jgi:HEAT repeat protein
MKTDLAFVFGIALAFNCVSHNAFAVKGTDKVSSATGEDAVSSNSQTDFAQKRTPEEVPLFGGRDFNTWVHLLKVDLDIQTRWQAVLAIGALGRHGHEKDALKVLTPLVRSEDRSLIYPSHQALAQLGDEGIDVLVAALREATYPHRESIIEALGKAGPQAASSVDILLELVEGSDVHLRGDALESLLKIGEPASRIAAVIEKEVGVNDDPHATSTIIFGLRDSPMNYEIKETLLIKWLDSNDRTIAHSAATILSMAGRNNETVRNALRSAMRKYATDPTKSGACPNVAAKDINVELVLPLLIEVAEEQDLADAKVRDGVFMRSFVDHVGGLGERGRAAVPTLLKIFAARNGPSFAQVDSDIVQSLWEMGAAARDALPVLEQTKKDALELRIEQGDTYRQRDRDFRVQQLERTIQRIRSAAKQ